MSDTDARFKTLTAGNWLEPDPTGDAFGEVHLGTGQRRPMSGDRWAEHFLRVELSAEIPGDVRDMWAIARGVLLYGWFFYSLYALGDAELHRVADAAVLHRYQQANGPPGPRSGAAPSLGSRLEWLTARGIIRKESSPRWDAIRRAA